MPDPTGDTPTDPPVTLEPEPSSWAHALRAPLDLSPARARFREQLGLPLDRPVIMTGHQAQFWHPGIVAKLFALDAAARTAGAATAWLIPDQDTPDPELARFPARGPDGRMITARWAAQLPPQVATGSLGPVAPPPAPREVPAIPSAADGLRAMSSALAAASGEATFALQVTRAAMTLLESLAGPLASTPIILTATRLASSDLFSEIVARLRADPARAVSLYNAAVGTTPDADLRPLEVDPARGPELPLWRLQPGRPRSPVFAADLDTIPPSELAPRALLLTGLMRLAACEVFIHGTGGAAYDRASEHWLASWLNDGPWPELTRRPALSAVATATLLLPLGVEPITPPQLARARWLAHHARHNPGDLGDAQAQQSKLAHVAMLRDLPRRSHARAEAFRVLHSTLDAARASRRARLGQIEQQAADLAARAESGQIAADRTFPFPLHAPDALRGLRATIERAFAHSGG